MWKVEISPGFLTQDLIFADMNINTLNHKWKKIICAN